MYNPYNWTIKPKYDYLAKPEWESDEEYRDRLEDLLFKEHAYINVIMLGIQMARLNLIDSLRVEAENGNISKTVDYDMSQLSKQREKYCETQEKIKYIEEKIKESE